MKTKQTLPDSVVTSKFFDIQKVALSLEIKGNDYNESDWILAHLLTALKSFDEQISSARKELEIKDIYKYSSITTLSDLFKITYSLGQEKTLLSMEISKNIVKEYKLSRNWLDSIQVAIFTDTLPVPTKSEIIQIETQDMYHDNNFDFCSIRINQRITTNQLKNWIKKNKLRIRLNLNNLPKIKKPKIDSKTIIWGHMAWIFKSGKMNSWTEMSKFIQQKIEELEEFGPIYGEKYAPEPVEMERYYKRFVEALKKIEK